MNFDQEVSIVAVKSSSMSELCSVEGSTIVSEESRVGASAANATNVKSVWEMHNVVSPLDVN